MLEIPGASISNPQLAVVHAELEQRLRAGQCAIVESLLQRYPYVATDADAVLELIYAEYALTNRIGPARPQDYWIDRFPAFRDQLERLFGFHELLSNQDTWHHQTAATLNHQAPTKTDGAFADHPPGYKLLNEIGRGGMAVVYRANQVSLQRTVAIKVLRGAARVDADRQLRDEATFAARLQHANIVQVFEFGNWGGVPFLAMEYVPGGGLDAFLAHRQLSGNSWMPPSESAQIVETLANAMAYAHCQGVVHRDLKPSNVLVASTDSGTIQPSKHLSAHFALKIADFGLAVFQDPAESLQHSITISGTPCYMSPEQATGRESEIGPRSDVYALGGILYELVTGRPPFRAESVVETLDLVRNAEPIAPRRLQAQVPLDLETICLKCLRKSHQERYESAEALADDLRRFQNNQPILARPVSSLERGAKWIQQHRIITGLTASLLVVGLATVGVLAASRFHRQSAIEKERALGAELKRSEADKLIATARSLWHADNLDDARRTLAECPGAYRNSEWSSLYHLCHAEVARWTGVNYTAARMAINSDGSVIAYRRHTAPRFISLVDAKSGESRGSLATGAFPLQMEFSADGRSLVVLRQVTESVTSKSQPPRGHEVTVWDVTNNAVKLRWTVPENGAMISQWGKHVAAADGQFVRVWDGGNGKLIGELAEPMDRKGRPQITIDDDGNTLAIGVPSALHLWNLTTGQMENSIELTSNLVGPLNFRRDGRVLFGSAAQSGVTAEEAVNRRAIVAWNVTDGQREFEIPAHVLAIYALSPDGRHLAYLKSNNIELHDAHSGAHLATLRGHRGTVFCLAFSGDGRRLYSSGADNTLRTWNVEPWRD